MRRWGTHPSWSRLLGNPRLYPDIEERLTELLGAPDSLVLPTITHIHAFVLPVLAGGGTVLLEAQAHRTIYDGATAAAAAGTTVRRFRPTISTGSRSSCAGPRYGFHASCASTG